MNTLVDLLKGLHVLLDQPMDEYQPDNKNQKQQDRKEYLQVYKGAELPLHIVHDDIADIVLKNISDFYLVNF